MSVPSSRVPLPREVLVLQHARAEGPGLIADALALVGVGQRLVRIDAGEAVPHDGEGSPGLVVMGGPMGVQDADRLAHLRDELKLIEWFLARGRPVLGVCLGSQLLAAALGARVYPGTREIGWIPIELDPAAERDLLFAAAAPSFTPLQWHGDAFDLPPGAVRLARSAATENQAFRSGSAAWGLLFHLEATASQVADMVSAFPDELRAAGIDGAALLAEAPGRVRDLAHVAGPALRAWAWRAARAT